MDAATIPQPTDYQIKRFNDVRFLLSWLYKYCMSERKHLKTLKGKQAAMLAYAPREEQQIKELDQWHFWLTAYMVLFMNQRWKDIRLSDPPPPKLPDHFLLRLQEHAIFEGLPMEEYNGASKLTSAERKILKELALRLAP
jgi:hypothetical protein